MIGTLRRVNGVLVALGAVTTLFIGAYIFCDVIGRSVFNHPLLGAYEIAQNGVVLAVFFALPRSVLNDDVLRIGGFYDGASFGVRRWVHLLGLALGLIFFVGLVATNWEPTVHAFRIHEVDGQATIRLPMGPVRGTLLFLWTWAGINVAYLIVKVAGSRRGDAVEADSGNPVREGN